MKNKVRVWKIIHKFRFTFSDALAIKLFADELGYNMVEIERFITEGICKSALDRYRFIIAQGKAITILRMYFVANVIFSLSLLFCLLFIW